MDERYAKCLLNKVQRDYNLIAEHFSKTRDFLWEELKNFSQFCREGQKILDLGCGNGRLLKLFEDIKIDYIGVDASEKLIELAKKRHPKARFQKADALSLPLPANYFDRVFSIAVFHHIPSEKFRLRFLQEARRVLKPEGLLILTVWNLYRRRFFKYHLKYTLLKVIGKSKLDFKDIFYAWKSPRGETLVQRYIHCFTIGELKNLAKKSGFEIKEIGFSGKRERNIYLVAKKPALGSSKSPHSSMDRT